MSVGILRRRAFSGLPLQGHKLVRLIHLDEAGIGDKAVEPYCVVAGTITEPDRHHKNIEDYLQKLALLAVPMDKAELFEGFHAADLWNGTGKVFKGWHRHRTMPIIEAIVRVLKRLNPAIVYGASDRSRYLFNPRPDTMKTDVEGAYATSFLMALLRANRWMRQNARPDEVAMVVVEDNNEMRRAAKLVQGYLRYPLSVPPELRDDLPLERIIESVLFAKKHESYVLWLADMCAYLIKRKISGYEVYGLFDWIAPLIDRSTNVENDPVAKALAKIPRYRYVTGSITAALRFVE